MLAEYTTVEEAFFALKPNELSLEEPVVIQAACGGLKISRLSHGKSLLVLGGGGDVGTLEIQVLFCFLFCFLVNYVPRIESVSCGLTRQESTCWVNRRWTHVNPKMS